MSNDYYFLLGISPSATADEVRQAYLRLAKIYHPDRNNSSNATKMMAEINLAYETLCDDGKRKKYDLKNDIVTIDESDKVQVEAQFFEDESEIGYEPSAARRTSKCVKCDFVNNSGVFVCSTCGYVFDPQVRHDREGPRRNDRNEELDDDQDTAEDNLSDIIRCPQCDEINMYSRGSCWHCGLDFEVDEIA